MQSVLKDVSEEKKDMIGYIIVKESYCKKWYKLIAMIDSLILL